MEEYNAVMDCETQYYKNIIWSEEQLIYGLMAIPIKKFQFNQNADSKMYMIKQRLKIS